MPDDACARPLRFFGGPVHAAVIYHQDLDGGDAPDLPWNPLDDLAHGVLLVQGRESHEKIQPARYPGVM
jgi:hypothetical protein